jgi:2-C-methyl-D-erythritol 4-phosphate cytidylyltransferase
MKNFVIIPAGGKGVRSGFAAPKQYIKFAGKELIVYTLEVFQKNKFIDNIILAAEPKYFNLLLELKKKYHITKISSLVEGGKTRQDSVYNALKSISAKKNDLIIVHDAARPLISPDVLTNSINLAKKKGNAVVCVKVSDTLIKGSNKVDSYLNREEVLYVQTPQIFKYKDLMDAMLNAYKNNFIGTDESMLVKRMGKEIYIAEGSLLNFKVTTKSDLELFSWLVRKK